MQQLWLRERLCDIVAHELGLDPVEVPNRNYIRAEGDAVRNPEQVRVRLRRLCPLPGRDGGTRGGDEPTQFHLTPDDERTSMRWEADDRVAGPIGSMGQRVFQPIVNQ
jgi:hypothetical protein